MSKYYPTFNKIGKMLLINTLLLLSIYVAAQDSTIIGVGTLTHGRAPLGNYYKYQASELRYTGAEINKTGTINAIAFYKGAGSENTSINNVTIYMKAVSGGTIGSTATTTGYTQVYSGSFPNNGTGWQSITLSTPFNYSSTANNLYVLVVSTHGAYSLSNYPQYRYSTSASNFSYYNNDTNPWANGSSSMTTSSSSRPNILLKFAPAVNCSAVTFPTTVNATASKTTICNSEDLSFNLAATMPAATGVTYQWKASGNGLTYSNIGTAAATPAATITVNASAKYFKCDVLCNGSTVLTSSPIQITVQLEVTTTSASRCGAGAVTLQAATAIGNTLKWYDQATNGSLLNTGSSYTTPTISNNTTYYVAATGGGSDVHVGPTSPSIGSLGSTNNGYGMAITTTNAIVLKSVNIFPVDAGSNYIQLRNSSGVVIDQILVTVSSAEANSDNSTVGTPKTVTLNWNLAAGTTYQLYWPQTAYNINRLLRNLSGAAAYYNAPAGGVAFTNHVGGSGVSYWYYFYDMIVTAGCGEGTRVPVTATINPAVAGVTATNDATVPGAAINFASTPNAATSYAWSGPNSFSSVQQNPVIATGSTSHNGVYTVTVTNSSNCSASANTTVVVTPTDYVWTGTVSTSWHNPANWNVNTVPNGNTVDVTIPFGIISGNYPELATTATVRNIIVEGDARITLNATLRLRGNWIGGTSSNAVVLGTGKVSLNGISAHTISGNTQLQTLLLNNSQGASLTAGASVEVFKAVELEAGTLNVINGTLRFRSTSATECAIINNFALGYSGNISGSIETERYYDAPSANSFNQHYMGSPVDAPTVAQFGASGTAGYINSHNNCYVDVMVNGSPNGTFYEYDEVHGNQCAIECWKVVTAGNATNGKGYSVAKTGAGVLTLNGNANLNATYTIGSLGNAGWSNQLSYQTIGSNTSFTVHAGWHLVSNPYLAPLNITTHPANNAFDPQIQVWETTGSYAGSYQPLTTNVNAQIAPFQAFMIHKTNAGSTSSYTLYASDRNTNNTNFYRQANISELKLIAANTATGLLDKTLVAFNSDATTQFDPMYDANKVQGANDRHTLRTVLNNTEYAINTLGDLAQTTTVPVSMRAGLGGTFTFGVEGINTFEPTSYIYLEDKVTGEWIDLRQQSSYTFAMAMNEAEDRFVLHFTPAAVINTINATCDAQGTINVTQAGTANWNYTLTNANGVNISTGIVNETTPMAVTAPKGTYTLTLIDANNYSVARILMVDGADPAQAGFTASTTTIEENQEVVLIATNTNASYMWDLGNGLTAIGSGVTMAYTQAGVYTVTLQTTNSYGCTATSTQLITVTEAVSTGIKNTDNSSIAIWGNGNTVIIQLSANAQANTAEFYNAIGQLLHTAILNNSNYTKSFDNISAATIIVKVLSNEATTIKKVTITN